MSSFGTTSKMLNLPTGCPDIPDKVPLKSLAGVVDIEVFEAREENEGSPFSLLDLDTQEGEPLGGRIFLHRRANRKMYSFGAKRDEQYDFYLPILSATKKLFELVYDEPGGWCIYATSNAIVIVNGQKIQKPQPRSLIKAKKDTPLPSRVYLDVSKTIAIFFADKKGDVALELWLIQSPDDVLRSKRKVKTTSLPQVLQHVADPNEDGAKGLYIWDHRINPVSIKSYRITHRFTGEWATAKVYQGVSGIEDRDREFPMFGKENVHQSIVRYQAATELKGVPAVITDTHESMVSFAAIESDLPDMHPGLRFKLAADMFRPLFSAVAYLHYNRIIHGSISSASVLIQIVNGRIRKLLLADYSHAYLIDIGEDMPEELMRHEGCQAMDIIQTCCDMWTVRQKPLPEFTSKPVMEQLIKEAERLFDLIKKN